MPTRGETYYSAFLERQQAKIDRALAQAEQDLLLEQRTETQHRKVLLDLIKDLDDQITALEKLNQGDDRSFDNYIKAATALDRSERGRERTAAEFGTAEGAPPVQLPGPVVAKIEAVMTKYNSARSKYQPGAVSGVMVGRGSPGSALAAELDNHPTRIRELAAAELMRRMQNASGGNLVPSALDPRTTSLYVDAVKTIAAALHVDPMRVDPANLEEAAAQAAQVAPAAPSTREGREALRKGLARAEEDLGGTGLTEEEKLLASYLSNDGVISEEEYKDFARRTLTSPITQEQLLEAQKKYGLKSLADASRKLTQERQAKAREQLNTLMQESVDNLFIRRAAEQGSLRTRRDEALKALSQTGRGEAPTRAERAGKLLAENRALRPGEVLRGGARRIAERGRAMAHGRPPETAAERSARIAKSMTSGQKRLMRAGVQAQKMLKEHKGIPDPVDPLMEFQADFLFRAMQSGSTPPRDILSVADEVAKKEGARPEDQAVYTEQVLTRALAKQLEALRAKKPVHEVVTPGPEGTVRGEGAEIEKVLPEKDAEDMGKSYEELIEEGKDILDTALEEQKEKEGELGVTHEEPSSPWAVSHKKRKRLFPWRR